MTITGTESRFQKMKMEVEELEVAGTDVTAPLDGLTASAAELNFNDGATAGTAVASKTMVTGAQNQIGGGWKDNRTTQLFRQPAPAAHTGTVTLTAANLASGLITGNPAAVATYTTPTGTQMDTELINAGHILAVDDAFEFSLINIATTAANDITIAAGTGWTTVGNMVVEAHEAGLVHPSNGTFRARRTGSNTWVLYRVS